MLEKVNEVSIRKANDSRVALLVRNVDFLRQAAARVLRSFTLETCNESDVRGAGDVREATLSCIVHFPR